MDKDAAAVTFGDVSSASALRLSCVGGVILYPSAGKVHDAVVVNKDTAAAGACSVRLVSVVSTRDIIGNPSAGHIEGRSISNADAAALAIADIAVV